MTNEIPLTIVGNLTHTPELGYSQNGIAYVNLTIAHTPRHFDKQANAWKDGEPTFLRGTLWREFAENAAASLEKGTRVVAHASLQARSYQTKEGEKRTALELKIEAIGPDLRYASATVTRAPRQGATDRGQEPASQPSDSWTTVDVPTDETPF